MPVHDDYLYHRAETELAQAQRATNPAVMRAHYELANLYLDRFYNPDGQYAARYASSPADDD